MKKTLDLEHLNKIMRALSKKSFLCLFILLVKGIDVVVEKH